MHIKLVVIDGFKSYAQRTEITGFDPQFNAITGLNGSGKSNILDAICFLLGITNLSQVRAMNLQELVYKNGQAGITKATVSVTFENLDKKGSPVGYEQYDEITVTRQVVIGGRNKYLINGSNANNTRVQDLFRSVQLNVNNPHFLIMQGRITKVINMKPPEILSMIEEAAGTRLYESKKENAQKTIEKKDAKLKEIDTVLKEEINPTLKKLKDERSSYLEYQKIQRELDHLSKLYIAYQFVCAEESRLKSADDLVEMQKTMETLQTQQTEMAGKIKDLDKVIADLERQRAEEEGGIMTQLEAEVSEKQKQEAKANSSLNSAKDNLKQEQRKLKDTQKQKDSDATSLANKEKELKKVSAGVESLDTQMSEMKTAYENAQKHFHAVSAGLSSNQDGEDASLNDQLITAKKEISQAETDIKQAQMRLKHAQAEVKKKQADLKKTEQGYQKDKVTHDKLTANVQHLKKELEKLDYEEGQEERLFEQRRQLQGEVEQLQEQVDTLEARFPQLHFQYSDPERGFDRSKVHGLVAKLIKVHDGSTATALEVAAGGKLYNVVVDNEQIGKKLLEKGQLRRRVTIIPLNKIAARSIAPNVVNAAKSLVGASNVQTALSLVGYESQLEKAMEFVFGGSFVCKDMNTAKKVTFDERIMKKSVTLDGDSFDPAGTLTGGARAQTSSILLKLGELKDAESRLAQAKSKLKELGDRLHKLKSTAHRYREVKQQHELKLQEAHLLEERLKQSSHGQQLEEITDLTTSSEEQEKVLKDAQEIKKKAEAKTKDLEDKLKNAASIREKELQAAQKAVDTAKKRMEDCSKKYKDKHQEVETVQLELDELQKDIKNYEGQLKVIEEAIAGFQAQIEQLTDTYKQAKEAVKEAQSRLNEQKEQLKARNKDIQARVSEQASLQKEINAAQLQHQELQHKVTKCSKDSKDAAKQVEHLLQKYDWIADEKKYFGQHNTAYDFETNDPKEAGKRIQKLQDTKDKLGKSVNMRAMNLLGKAEEQYNDLMNKRKIVLKDKAKIADVIRELDEKKNEALKKAYTQVNRDFGSIFSTLLPGTQAKLIAPEGQSVLDGLEVKIAFGDVWKETLSELSGGQRSLVALSLILAMLLFKPAPLYILDEVDAALDLSHTQNIGQMLRTHFSHSQFIVVSLKDGMFNNANVLFKTRFVDGVSMVTRYAQNQSQPSNLPGARREGGAKKDATKKGAKKPRWNEDIETLEN